MKDLSMAPQVFTAADFETQPLQWLRGSAKVIDCTEAAATANRLLSERGVRVWQTRTDMSKPGVHKVLSEWIEMDEWPGATHTALLVAVQPIERKDTAEQLVKDLAAHAKFQYSDNKWAMNAEYWVERAKRVLGAE